MPLKQGERFEVVCFLREQCELYKESYAKDRDDLPLHASHRKAKHNRLVTLHDIVYLDLGKKQRRLYREWCDKLGLKVRT